MDIQKIQHYKSAFDEIVKEVKDDEDNSIEVWYARELQMVLGYARWENFVVAIGRAMESCKTLGINVDDHFREVTKMIALPKGARRDVQDFMLTRYACYLIAQNR
jgi:DNA-damage-inducible protein D